MDRQTTELRDYHEMLVGLDLAFAKDMVKSLGGYQFTIRVVRVDGKPCVVTRDFRTDRVNVAIESGLIKSIVSIG